jgi:hypothetical protein
MVFILLMVFVPVWYFPATYFDTPQNHGRQQTFAENDMTVFYGFTKHHPNLTIQN